MKKIAIQITDILDTTKAKAIQVMVKQTGKPAWVPRRCAEFYPGRVVLPDQIALAILGEVDSTKPDFPPLRR